MKQEKSEENYDSANKFQRQENQDSNEQRLQ